MAEQEYKRKKERVQRLVEEMVKEEEEKESIKIMENKNENVWKIIKAITNQRKEESDLTLCRNGEELEDGEGIKELLEFWENIYDTGSEQSVEEERIEYKGPELAYGSHMMEHNYCKKTTVWNERPALRTEEIVGAIDSLKDGKAAGLSGVRSEMWKAVKQKVERGKIKAVFQKVMDGEIPESWKISKVNLIPKSDGTKVEIGDFRPLVLTEVSYSLKLWET